MSLYSVSGSDAAGKPFKLRFDAPSETRLSEYLGAEGCTGLQFRKLSGTLSPHRRFPWLTIISPIFALVMVQCIVSIAYELRGTGDRGFGVILLLLLIAAVMAWFVYNGVLRFGRMYGHNDNEIREYARGDSITLVSDLTDLTETAEDDEDEEEGDFNEWQR